MQHRTSGILLHPTSLPGRYGIGDLGADALRFVDWLAEAGQKWWQVMPLGPTGYGDSPYQAFSAFAGNPYLISFDLLQEEGLLSPEDLADTPDFPKDAVDYGWIYVWKYPKLAQAFAHFKAGKAAHLQADFTAFCQAEAHWLSDFALFMALKNAHQGAAWHTWPQDIRTRQPLAMQHWKDILSEQTEAIAFYQFLFFRQWNTLRAYARSKHVGIIGDIPIFVALDSADAWSAPEEFYFDEQGHPIVVAGVPPDYFSATGQLWGNPLYRWDRMQKDGFRWWIRRFQGALKLYDLIRIDHFRGFAAYWEIPAHETTAINGKWVDAPGHALFEAVRQALGTLPIIAEDLGVITPEVESLRDNFEFPGMAVLQFAFGDADYQSNAFFPENISLNRVVYTGTHDNQTTKGWFAETKGLERDNITSYLPDIQAENAAWTFIEVAWKSRATMAIAPLQDVLNLGAEARMNLPGEAAGNWSWRYQNAQLSHFSARQLHALTKATERNA